VSNRVTDTRNTSHLDPVALLKAADAAMYIAKGQRTRPHS